MDGSYGPGKGAAEEVRCLLGAGHAATGVANSRHQVLREKYDQAGKLGKRKARLTARGFTLHYDDTYAPVARPDSWGSLLVLALRDHWIVLQADVVAAYLNTPLKHEVYITNRALN